MNTNQTRSLERTDSFLFRHIGPRQEHIDDMLRVLGLRSLEELSEAVVPKQIRTSHELKLGPSRSESEVLAELKESASKNQVYRSFLGMGYSDCITPAVIQRNILENGHRHAIKFRKPGS